MEHLYRRRVSPSEVITPELAQQLAHLAFEFNRRIGVLISRSGDITEVVVGDAGKIPPPEMERVRRAGKRLSGQRFIYTLLKPEPLSKSDLSVLAHNRLDLLVSLEVQTSGGPGRIRLAHLLPENPQHCHWELQEFRDLSQLNLDFSPFIKALEDEFARQTISQAIEPNAEKAILVILDTGDRRRAEERRDEMLELARTSKAAILDTVIQRRPAPDPRFVLGKGKLDEVILRSLQLSADMLIFGCDLTPAQVRYISEISRLKIIDRTQLILDIFAQHAYSSDGKIQVELAQLKYLLPQLVNQNRNLSRLTGGIGARGPGETNLEIDRRRVRDRIARLEKELKSLALARDQRRNRRRKENIPIVSIVGYTNVGKSTLLNALTHSQVKTADQYFATLDTSSRRLRFPREREAIVTDTVGFINDLPPDLLKAFRATLEELRDADLLLHVVDGSHPHFPEQIEAVHKVLRELDLHHIPELVVFNKVDLISEYEQARIKERYQGLVISALQSEGLWELAQQMEAALARGHADWNPPLSDPGPVSEIGGGPSPVQSIIEENLLHHR